MVIVDDMHYHETLEILRGNKALPGIYIELKDWLKRKYCISAYNFIFREVKHDKSNNQRYELYILLSSTKDYTSMFNGYKYDEDKQLEIANKLQLLSQKYDTNNKERYIDAWICYNDFSVEMETDFYERAFQSIGGQLIKKYKGNSVWTICTAFNSVVVFYYNEDDVRTNATNGISKQIKDEFYTELKKLDEFDIFRYDTFSITYDSKENVDNNYAGSLYYYFK